MREFDELKFESIRIDDSRIGEGVVLASVEIGGVPFVGQGPTYAEAVFALMKVVRNRMVMNRPVKFAGRLRVQGDCGNCDAHGKTALFQVTTTTGGLYTVELCGACMREALAALEAVDVVDELDQAKS